MLLRQAILCKWVLRGGTEREGRLFLVRRLVHLCGVVSNRTRFLPASVSRRQTLARKIFVELPYDVRSWGVGRDVVSTSVSIRASLKLCKAQSLQFESCPPLWS